MIIKKLFERERLYTASVIDSYEHNRSIDRIEAAVTERIEELEAVLREVADCSSYWSEYFVPIGLPEKIETALKQEEK